VVPDKTRDARRLSGGRRFARNDNLRTFRRVEVGSMQVEGGLVAGRRRKLEKRQGRAVAPEPHRSPDGVGTSSDRPLPGERIRRSWEATKCTAMGQIDGLGLVVWPGRVVEFGFVAGWAKLCQ
jgi:hypothetical protein